MNKILNKLANLIDVKSIVTITFTICFAILSLSGVVSGADFITIFLVIITYYFSKKDETSEKKDTGTQ